MRVLYLAQRFDINNRGIQTDLLCALSESGHSVTIVACELRENIIKTSNSNSTQFEIIYVPIENQFGVSSVKKGIVQVKIPFEMIRSIKKRLSLRQYDLVLYATPPVTFAPVVAYCKKKYKCKSFLALKDIFPQNAVDLGLMSEYGLAHKVFRTIEKHLYKVSDYIGCMSDANIDYVKRHNPEIEEGKLLIFPNTIKPYEVKKDFSRGIFLDSIDVPKDKTIFLFGGNLGMPQAVDLLLDAIEQLKNYSNAYFLIIGKGSEYSKIETRFNEKKFTNAKLINFLPSEEYNQSILACDVGLILLKPEITVPNIPEKTLSYMANGRPIIAATDSATDVGDIIERQAHCGKWCLSSDLDKFIESIIYMCEHSEERQKMGYNARQYFDNNWDVSISIRIINSLLESTNNES